MDHFVFRLHQHAVSCDFGDREDYYVHVEVIDKCYSSRMRRKFPGVNIDVGRFVEDRRSQEAVDRL